MSNYNPTMLFDTLKQKEINANNSLGHFGNPNIFKPKIGTSYVLRLLWLSPDNTDREYPMINQYVHSFWDDEITNGSKEVTVYCKTSQYDMGETRAAFNDCPICGKSSEFYQDFKNNSSNTSKELYDKFGRKLHGYVPVYIVDGPESDKGQIKILYYGKLYKTFFDKKIFGIIKQQKNAKTDNKNEQSTVNSDEIIGVDAFMYYDPKSEEVITNGYDLLITVTAKKVLVNGKQIDMPDYSLDFSRKARNISKFGNTEISPEYFNSLSHELSFDKDLYKTSTIEELNEFKAKYIDDPSDESIEASNKVENDAKHSATNKLNNLSSSKSAKQNVEQEAEIEPEIELETEPEEDNEQSNSGDVNENEIEDLINNL